MALYLQGRKRYEKNTEKNLKIRWEAPSKIGNASQDEASAASMRHNRRALVTHTTGHGMDAAMKPPMHQP
ncbi:hypothetical protein BPY_16620 [Bifidobacterium psychraerophilum]